MLPVIWLIYGGEIIYLDNKVNCLFNNMHMVCLLEKLYLNVQSYALVLGL